MANHPKHLPAGRASACRQYQIYLIPPADVVRASARRTTPGRCHDFWNSHNRCPADAPRRPTMTGRCKIGREITKPAGRPILHRPDIVGPRPGIGYVSSKNRGIGRASCVKPIPAPLRAAVSNMFDIVGRPTPTRRSAGRSSETLPQKRHLQQQKSA